MACIAKEEFDFSYDDFTHFETKFGAKIPEDDFIEYMERYDNHACFELHIKCVNDQVSRG